VSASRVHGNDDGEPHDVSLWLCMIESLASNLLGTSEEPWKAKSEDPQEPKNSKETCIICIVSIANLIPPLLETSLRVWNTGRLRPSNCVCGCLKMCTDYLFTVELIQRRASSSTRSEDMVVLDASLHQAMISPFHA
jgi:hypothetical protein